MSAKHFWYIFEICTTWNTKLNLLQYCRLQNIKFWPKLQSLLLSDTWLSDSCINYFPLGHLRLVSLTEKFSLSGSNTEWVAILPWSNKFYIVLYIRIKPGLNISFYNVIYEVCNHIHLFLAFAASDYLTHGCLETYRLMFRFILYITFWSPKCKFYCTRNTNFKTSGNLNH